MCKIFIATNTSQFTDSQLLKLVKATSKELTKGNDDGFGYSIATDGGVFGERFLDVENMVFTHFGEKDSLAGPFDNYVYSEPLQNSFGTKSQHRGGLTLHARTSTNKLGLINTHPFIGERYSLIHNGVIENKGPKVKCESDNDSEELLRLFELGGIELLSSSAEGYYALGILDSHTGNTIVVRDSKASLYAAWLPKYESYFFATTREALNVAMKSVKAKGKINEVKNNTMLTFNVKGELIEITSFTPRERSFGELDAKSLGSSYSSSYSRSSYFDAYDDDAPSPKYRYEESIDYVDDKGVPLSADEYEGLTWAEQLNCSVYQNGRKIA